MDMGFNKTKYPNLLTKNKIEKKSFLHNLTKTSTLFYYCALISSWDDRGWFFLVGIYLVALDPSNLLLTAIFGLLSSGLVLVLGSWVGSWVDRTSRLTAAYIVLVIRNISTLICSLVLCLVFYYYDEIVKSNGYPTLLILAKISLIVFGVSAHLGGMTNDNMLSKDWLAVLCDGDSQLLSKMTAKFRLIDLGAKVIAPLIIGQIITFTNKAVASIVFSIQVLFTLMLFCFLLKVIYDRMPRLRYREVKMLTSYQSLLSDNENNGLPYKIEGDSSSSSCRCCSLFEGWKVYFTQETRFAGLGLALLYMTVLGFDTVTIGYALSQGMSEFVLSIFNAVSAITGIIGALMFPCILKCTNIVYTGIIAIFMQMIGLTPSIISVWIPGNPFNFTEGPVTMAEGAFYNMTDIIMPVTTDYNAGQLSLYLLMSGIVASRVGLWMFDLTVSQLLIETVYEEDRGKVNGVQNSLNMLFDMIKFGLVLWLPYPYQFGFLTLMSIGAVIGGSVLYTTFAIVNNCKVTIRH